MLQNRRRRIKSIIKVKRKIDLKIGDFVRILAGDDKNKISQVLNVNRYSGKVRVSGVALRQKYVKTNAQNPKSAKTIEYVESFIDISNVKKENKNE